MKNTEKRPARRAFSGRDGANHPLEGAWRGQALYYPNPKGAGRKPIGPEGEIEDNHILEQRTMSGWQDAELNAELTDGTWSLVMKRKLQSEKLGDLSMAKDKIYNLGFAIYDYSNAHFHHDPWATNWALATGKRSKSTPLPSKRSPETG